MITPFSRAQVLTDTAYPWTLPLTTQSICKYCDTIKYYLQMWRDMDSAKQWDPEKLHMSQFETKTDEYEQVY